MAPVKIKFIVSFSSQDQSHKASNISFGDGTKKWLSDCNDRSGKIEAILQLEESCQLAYIDIGTIWCASLEVRVGRSDWPQTAEFQSLIPTVSLMTPVDCRLSRGSSVTKMFSKVDFSSEVAAQKWDRVQIICRQPFRKDVQLGVSFIRIKSANPAPSAELTTENLTKQVVSESKTLPDVSSIQQHFFKKAFSKTPDRASAAAQLKQRLLKISGSSENGSEHEQSLTRTAKLVLKASENSGTKRHVSLSAVTPKRGLFSDHLAKQKAVPIEQEIKAFLPTLKINLSDIEKVTVADLRHKFERKKRRKLVVEEKRTFSRLCEQFICTLLDEEGETDASYATAVSHLSTPENSNEIVSNQLNSISKNKSSTPSLNLLRNHSTAPDKGNLNVISPISKSVVETELKPQLVSTPLTGDKVNNRVCTNQTDDLDKDFNSSHLPLKVNGCPLTSLTLNYPLTEHPDFILSPKTKFSRVSPSVEDIRIKSESRNKNRDTANYSSDISSISDDSEKDHDCLSSVTYDEDEEEQALSDESDPPSPDSSPNLLQSTNSKQRSNLENVKKSYEKFYSSYTELRQKEKSENPETASSAKKQKFNQESSQVLQGASIDAMALVAKNKIKDCPEDAPISTALTGDGPMLFSINSVNDPISTILAVDSLPSSELMQSNVSPRTPKGKVYRMLTSPHVQSPKRQAQKAVTDLPLSNKGAKIAAVNERTAVFNNKDGLSKHVPKKEPAKEESSVFPPQLDFRFAPAGSSSRGKGGRGRGQQKVPGQTRISKRGRGRGQKSNINSLPVQGELIFCDKCYGEFPPDTFADHHSFCVRPSVFGEEDNNDLSSGATQHEILIDETVDYSECPICLERFPLDALPIHASECGL